MAEMHFGTVQLMIRKPLFSFTKVLLLKKIGMAEDERLTACQRIPHCYITLHHSPPRFLNLFVFYKLPSALCLVLVEIHHWTYVASLNMVFSNVL